MINKTFASLIALFFFVSANAQPYIIEVKDYKSGIPGVKREIDISAIMPATSGAPKSYVDSTGTAVTNNLKRYVQESLANYQAWAIGQFALKGSTTGTGTAEGQLINLPNVTWYKIIQPTNYGKVYANGTTQGRYFLGGYKDNTGVNFSTEREDKVFTIAAYNILQPNGSREFINEAAWDMTVETHYDNSGFLPYGDFEAHLFRSYVTGNGKEHRYHSVYGNKFTGKARQDFEANTFKFMSTINGTPQDFANLEVMNDDGDGTGAYGQLTFLAYKNANSGGKLKWNHNGIMSSIEGNSGGIQLVSAAGQSAYFDKLGNAFMGYLTGTTIFLGNEYDNRFIDRTKKLQVRGDVLIEGDTYIKVNGVIKKLVVSSTGAITAQ